MWQRQGGWHINTQSIKLLHLLSWISQLLCPEAQPLCDCGHTFSSITVHGWAAARCPAQFFNPSYRRPAPASQVPRLKSEAFWEAQGSGFTLRRLMICLPLEVSKIAQRPQWLPLHPDPSLQLSWKLQSSGFTPDHRESFHNPNICSAPLGSITPLLLLQPWPLPLTPDISLC